MGLCKGGIAVTKASKILALHFVNFLAVLHTMNIEGQIHQKNLGMGQTPPPPFWQCQDFGSTWYGNPSLTPATRNFVNLKVRSAILRLGYDYSL